MIERLPEGKKIILFDGVCNLCDSAVQYIIRHDLKDIFRFVALQSELGIDIQRQIGIADKSLDSIILYEPGKAYYYKFEAVVGIARSFGGIFIIAGLLSFVPRVMGNTIYDYIARNRYNWYGKKDACLVPTPELKFRFLE